MSWIQNFCGGFSDRLNYFDRNNLYKYPRKSISKSPKKQESHMMASTAHTDTLEEMRQAIALLKTQIRKESEVYYYLNQPQECRQTQSVPSSSLSSLSEAAINYQKTAQHPLQHHQHYQQHQPLMIKQTQSIQYEPTQINAVQHNNQQSPLSALMPAEKQIMDGYCLQLRQVESASDSPYATDVDDVTQQASQYLVDSPAVGQLSVHKEYHVPNIVQGVPLVIECIPCEIPDIYETPCRHVETSEDNIPYINTQVDNLFNAQDTYVDAPLITPPQHNNMEDSAQHRPHQNTPDDYAAPYDTPYSASSYTLTTYNVPAYTPHLYQGSTPNKYIVKNVNLIKPININKLPQPSHSISYKSLSSSNATKTTTYEYNQPPQLNTYRKILKSISSKKHIKSNPSPLKNRLSLNNPDKFNDRRYTHNFKQLPKKKEQNKMHKQIFVDLTKIKTMFMSRRTNGSITEKEGDDQLVFQ